MQSRVLWRGATLLTVATALLSCSGGGGDGGGGGGGGGGATGPTASIQIAVAPAALSVQQGGTGSATVTVTRTNFTGAVALTLDAPPAGIVGTFSPASVTGDNATLSLTVASSAAAATHVLTIRANGSGVSEQTATLALTVTPPPAAIAVTATPSSITLVAGTGTASVTFAYARTNFTGPIQIAHVQGLPSGATVADPTGPTTGNSGTLVFSMTSAAPPGTYAAVFEASGAGATPGRVTITITVTAPTGSIAVSASPANFTTVAGGITLSTTITLVRTNFTGMVAFSASLGNMAGAVGFTVISTTGNTTTLAITVSVGNAPGTYTVTVTATGAGIIPASVPIQVTVVPASQVEFQFCDALENPFFFAAWTGSGAWAPVIGTLTGGVYRYRFNIPLGNTIAGVAVVQAAGSAGLLPRTAGTGESPGWISSPRPGLTRVAYEQSARADATLAALVPAFQTIVIYGTPAELQTLGAKDCSSGTTRTVGVPFAGVATGTQAYLSLIRSGAYVLTGGVSTSPQTMSNVPSGTIDLVGSRIQVPGRQLEKLLLARDLDPPDGSTLPFTADFDGPLAFAPSSAAVSFSNTLGDNLSASVSFYSSRGTYGYFGAILGSSSMLTRTWYGIPDSRLRIGDVFQVGVMATPPTQTLTEYRSTYVLTSAVRDVPLILGAPLPQPSVSRVGVSGRRIRVQGTIPVEYGDLFSLYYSTTASGANFVRMYLTRGFLGAAGASGSYDVSTPDLLGLNGFPVASEVPAGAWLVGVQADGWGARGILKPDRVNGVVHRSAFNSVNFTMP